jgi:hypothetical protein
VHLWVSMRHPTVASYLYLGQLTLDLGIETICIPIDDTSSTELSIASIF